MHTAPTFLHYVNMRAVVIHTLEERAQLIKATTDGNAADSDRLIRCGANREASDAPVRYHCHSSVHRARVCVYVCRFPIFSVRYRHASKEDGDEFDIRI